MENRLDESGLAHIERTCRDFTEGSDSTKNRYPSVLFVEWIGLLLGHIRALQKDVAEHKHWRESALRSMKEQNDLQNHINETYRRHVARLGVEQ